MHDVRAPRAFTFEADTVREYHVILYLLLMHSVCLIELTRTFGQMRFPIAAHKLANTCRYGV